ncbi:MAG: hypothetical protein RL699_1768 [Bacteroidota bacterium]|jgi:hypothetical protein
MLEKGNLENSYCKLENHAKGFARERRWDFVKAQIFNQYLQNR